jgi:hypothetical protein
MNAASTRQIIGANNTDFISLAKLDHVIWKVNTLSKKRLRRGQTRSAPAIVTLKRPAGIPLGGATT